MGRISELVFVTQVGGYAPFWSRSNSRRRTGDFAIDVDVRFRRFAGRSPAAGGCGGESTAPGRHGRSLCTEFDVWDADHRRLPEIDQYSARCSRDGK